MDALGGGKTDTAAATDAPVSQNFFCHSQKNTIKNAVNYAGCIFKRIYHFDLFILVTYGMEGGWEILGEFGKVLSVQPGSLYSSCR